MENIIEHTNEAVTAFLSEIAIKDLQIALLEHRLAVAAAHTMVERAAQCVTAAFTAAGLDSTKTYRLDLSTRTAIEVVK